MINTVIFDMDGVIVDTEPVHAYAFFKHFEQLGLTISKEEYETFTGLSTRNVYQHLKQKYGLPQEVEDLVQQKRNIFNHAFDEKEDLELMPGVQQLIENLHRDKFQIILGSSSARVTIARIFKRFNLAPYFSHIVSGEDFPKSKPDPTIFIKAAEVSGEQRNRCIVIEDSTNGVRAANAAGIFCVGYTSDNSNGQDLTTADKIISRFTELTPDIIRNFVKE